MASIFQDAARRRTGGMVPELNFGEIDFGLREGESMIPLPATETLRKQSQTESPFGSLTKMTSVTPQDEHPPTTQPTPDIPEPFGGTFELGGPLTMERMSPEQIKFTQAVADAVAAGEQDRLIELFGSGGTDLGTFENLADPFVGNLALQAFPALFPDRLAAGDPNTTGAQRIHRIQKILAGIPQGQAAGGGGGGATGTGQSAGGGGGGSGGGGGGGTGGGGGGGGGLPPLPNLPIPGGGGPSSPQFGSLPPDELSQIITDRLGGIISAPDAGIPDLPVDNTGRNVQRQIAQQDPRALPPIPENELSQMGIEGLRNQIETGGLDPDLLFDVRKSLRENLEGERQAGVTSIQETLAERGIARGGTAQEAIVNMDERMRGEMFRNLRDVATQMGLSAADRQLVASQAAATLGQQRRGQDLSLISEREARQLAAATGLTEQDIQRRGQDLDLLQTRLATTLSAVDLATQRALGIGDLNLRNLATNIAFQESIFNQRMDVARFTEAAQQARAGNVASLIGLLLQLGSQLQAGHI